VHRTESVSVLGHAGSAAVSFTSRTGHSEIFFVHISSLWSEVQVQGCHATQNRHDVTWQRQRSGLITSYTGEKLGCKSWVTLHKRTKYSYGGVRLWRSADG